MKKKKTIPCPAHGQPMRTEEIGNYLIGICICDVPNNRYKGVTVYKTDLVKVKVKSEINLTKESNDDSN